MEQLPNSEALERATDREADYESTLRLLGSLGLYDASRDNYINPPEPSNVFKTL